MNLNNIINNSTIINTVNYTDPNYDTVDPREFYIEIVGQYKQEREWIEINKAAKTNEALQNAIDRVKIIYYLSKENGNSKT
jgi:hypothetical protein